MPDNLTDSELLKRSVTKDEITTVRDGAILRVMVPYQTGYDRFALPPKPPAYWSIQRDIILRSTIHHEAMWAAAIGICISKTASLSWEVQGKVGLRVRAMQDILLDADGKRVGWVGFLSKQLRDYLTTDNGSFFEIIRASRARGSKILGIRHLDSLRVTRTGDPDIPVIYRDRWGKWHEMKDYQVVLFADMPDPGETYYGVGLSATSRAYPAIYKLAVIENYLREKVAGLRPLAIYIVNGVLDTQLKGAIDAAKQEQVARGLVGYMGAVIIGIPDEMQPQVATIPLAELPDNFTRKEEFDISVLTYADVLGLDPQDLQPLGGQALGTGAQSVVLHEKARGKGMNAWKQDFTHALNEFIMPEETIFTFTEKDYRDITARANAENTIATAAAARIGAKITTPAQELELMVDQDILPKEYLPRDIVPGDNLSDTEKPISASPSAFDPEQPLAEQAQGRLDEEGNIKPGAKTDAQLQNEEVARMIASGQGDQVGYGGGDKRSPDEIHASKVESEKKKADKVKTKELIDAVSESAALYAKEVVERQLESLKGGPGSGSFGHAGRPGKVGGQAPNSADPKPKGVPGNRTDGKGNIIKGDKKIPQHQEDSNPESKLRVESKPKPSEKKTESRISAGIDNVSLPIDSAVKKFLKDANRYRMNESDYMALPVSENVVSMLSGNMEKKDIKSVGYDPEEVERFPFIAATDQYRGKVKNEIADEISAMAGVDKNTVALVMDSWATTSNDSSGRSLEIQESVSRVLGSPMSEWQKKNLDTAREETAFFEKAVSFLKDRSIGGLDDMIDLSLEFEKKFPTSEFQDIEDANGKKWMLFEKAAKYMKDPKKYPYGDMYLPLDKKDVDKTVKAIYEKTQAELKKLGVDRIIVYRGVGDKVLSGSGIIREGPGMTTVVPEFRGKTIQYRGNSAESWSIHPSVAKHFGWVIAASIPRERVFCTAGTGLGCLTEGEAILLGNQNAEVTFIG